MTSLYDFVTVAVLCCLTLIVGIGIGYSMAFDDVRSSLENVLSKVQIQQVNIQFNETVIADVINRSIAQAQYETQLRYEKVNP